MIKTIHDQMFVSILAAGFLVCLSSRVLYLNMMKYSEPIRHFETPYNRAMRLITPITGLVTSGGFLVFMLTKFNLDTIFEQMSVIYNQASWLGVLGCVAFGAHALTVVLAPVFVLRQLHYFRRRPHYLSPDMLLP